MAIHQGLTPPAPSVTSEPGETAGVLGSGAAVRTVRALLSRHPILAPVVVTVLVRLCYLTTRYGIDEGGFAMVARYAGRPGPYLYGPQWVDRPPLLILVFRIADDLGPFGVRIVAGAIAVGTVVALGTTAERLAGRSAAAWTSWTAAAFVCSVFVEANALNGELIAAFAVALTIGATLAAFRGRAGDGAMAPRVALGWAAVAGCCAMSAVLIKQNFVDGIVFAGVMGLLSIPKIGWARVFALGGAFVAGMVPPAVGALVWALGHGGIGELLYAMYGFRVDATAIMATNSDAGSAHGRSLQLILVAVISGLAVLALFLLLANGRRLLRPGPLTWALTVTFAVEVVGIVAGANFWPHYLLGAVPALALAVGLSAVAPGGLGRAIRIVVTASAAVSLVAGPALTAAGTQGSAVEQGVAYWLKQSAHPGDTVTVAFSHADVVDMSGLAPGYPYAWSLPARTLDPQLSLFVSILAGPHAPTWVVRWDSTPGWGMHDGSRVDAVLESHYRRVVSLCGRAVWLHTGAQRTLAAPLSERICHGAG